MAQQGGRTLWCLWRSGRAGRRLPQGQPSAAPCASRSYWPCINTTHLRHSLVFRKDMSAMTLRAQEQPCYVDCASLQLLACVLPRFAGALRSATKIINVDKGSSGMTKAACTATIHHCPQLTGVSVARCAAVSGWHSAVNTSRVVPQPVSVVCCLSNNVT